MSLFPKDHIQDTKELCQKATRSVTDLFVKDANYKVTELAKIQDSMLTNIPILVAKAEQFKDMEKELEIVIQDAHEIQEQVREMDRIESLGTSIELLQKHLTQLQRM
jgi:uncharacterized protein YecA (UPF0149 family)